MSTRMRIAGWLVAVGLGVGMAANAGVLVTDNFDYTGPLANNGWVAYSGADGSITADGSVANIGSGAEDIRLPFTDQLTGPTYASFILNVATLPAAGLEYSFGFIDNTTMESRFGLISVGGTAFRLGAWGAGNAALSTNNADLSLNTDYLVTVYFDGVNDHRLWIDAVSTDFGSPAAQATAANNGMDGFFIRQAGTMDNGDAAWTMNDLIVATTFEEVVPAGGPPPTNVSFTISSASVDEDAGTYEVTITKSLPEGNVSGEIALSGTATEGVDYSINTTSFTMNGATTSATFTITIVDDAEEEADETVILTLVNVVGGTIATPSVFTLTIIDNDAVPPPPGSIVIDFEGASETKGSYATGNVTLSGLLWEMSESVIGTGATDRKNGARSARFRTNDVSRMTLLEDLTNGVGDVSFLHAVFGSDGNSALELEYSVNGGASWLSAGSVTNTSTDLTLFSTSVDQPGNVRLRITKIAGNATSRANVDDIIIVPFDGPPPPPTTNVSFTVASASVGEGDGEYVVTVIKSLPEGNISGEITLGGTATEGVDYSINTTSFTMNGATTSATFTITIVDDADVEGNETVILTLVNVVGGTIGSPSVFTLTIVDNDEPPPPPPPAGAIAYYTFTGSTNTPDFVSANADATLVTLTAGAITYASANGATWTNASGVPYIRSVGGWTNDNQADAKAFEVTITADSGYVLTVTNVSFYYRATAAGPSAIGFSLDGTPIYNEDATNNATTLVSQPITGYANLDAITLSVQGWTNGWRVTGGGGELHVDDVLVQGFLTPDGGPVIPVEQTITAISASGTTATVTLGGSQVGVTYVFRYTTDLSTPQMWTQIGTPTPGTGSPMNFIDLLATDAARLYHVEAQPVLPMF